MKQNTFFTFSKYEKEQETEKDEVLKKKSNKIMHIYDMKQFIIFKRNYEKKTALLKELLYTVFDMLFSA